MVGRVQQGTCLEGRDQGHTCARAKLAPSAIYSLRASDEALGRKIDMGSERMTSAGCFLILVGRLDDGYRIIKRVVEVRILALRPQTAE